MFGGVVGGRRCEGSTVPARGEAVNVDVSHIEGKGHWEIVRRAVGSEAGRVSYLSAGGPAGTETVLLIHGVGVSARSWIHQLQGLAGTLRVPALDLPGHGESARSGSLRSRGLSSTRSGPERSGSPDTR